MVNLNHIKWVGIGNIILECNYPCLLKYRGTSSTGVVVFCRLLRRMCRLAVEKA
jgi:hypothetical protein